ncbi:PstS family phosphate ABC transporter substrate-binding protein [Alkalibacillus aidingensis]|uniref:PstS family phosphate ABC transporter substrate-binding protein n=1 Tax=Alkalibacillus aidingensis TaxID=2747607 RepID=UPI0016601EBC|nr:substrate-binding domain-containing protein [Alkalibacillus aidingensis]
MGIVQKIMLAIFFSVGIGFFGFVLGLISLFSGGQNFMAPFIAGVALGSIILVNLRLFNAFNKKLYKKIAWSFYGLCAIMLVSYIGYSYYLESIQVVSTQDVDLREYEPFSSNTKVVELEDEATFQINHNPPKLDGSTALYPVYAAFAQAVYPEGDYDPYSPSSEVKSTQTDGAYQRLIDGEVDIIFAPEPSSNQKRKIENSNLDVKWTPIGREAFIFFTHSDNPVDRLTTEEIQGIYAGEITNWSEVGGRDQEIKAFQRPENSGSQSALRSFMGTKQLMKPPQDDVVSAMGGIVEQTQDYHNHRYAIGFSFRFFASEMVDRGRIEFIEIDGVYPDQESVRDGSYPIASEFYAVTADSDNEHVEGFLEWMKSEQGRWIIDQTGYAPVVE